MTLPKMGQTLSFAASTGSLFLTTEMPDSEPTGLRLLDSGLRHDMILPAPGWSVDSSLTLWFRPNALAHVNFTAWDHSRIATLVRPVAPHTRIGLVSSAHGVWATLPVEQDDTTEQFRLTCPAFVMLGEGFRCVGAVSTSPDPAAAFELAGADGSVRDGMLLLSEALLAGTHNLVLTATSRRGEKATQSISVRVDPPDVAPPIILNLNAHNRMDLRSDFFDSGSGAPTHVALTLNGAVRVVYKGDTLTASDTLMLTVARTDLGNVSVYFSGGSSSGSKRRRSSDSLSCWLSFDGGLSFTTNSIMSVGEFPCFDTGSRVCVGFQRGIMQWRRAVEIQPGETIIDCNGNVQTVRRVHVAHPAASHVVRIPKDAIAPGVPTRNTQITANHLLIVRDRCMRAGLLPTLCRHARLEISTQPICHIETDAYCFFWLDGLSAESHARTRVQLAQRQAWSSRFG